MKMPLAALAALTLIATPALADKRIDDALARAEDQILKGKTDDALKTGQKLVSQDPGNPEAHAALGQIQEKVGQIDEATATMKKAVELSGSAPPPVQAEVLAKVAGLALQSGSSKDALSHAEKAVAAQATPASLAVLARAQARAGNGAAALETAEKAVQQGAANASAHEAKGEALLAAGRAADAAASFGKAIETDPKFNRARVGLARALLAQGKAAEAVPQAQKAAESDGKSGEAYAIWGLALFEQNKNNWNEAIAQAQQGAFLTPRNPLVQVAVGKLFEANGNVQQAEAAYANALKADPAHLPAQVSLISVQIARGNLDAALPKAQELAAAAPNNGEAQLMVGQLLMRKEQFVPAVGPLARAAAAFPNRADVHAMLGSAYQHARQSAEALEAYKKAVTLDPNNADYRSTYGLLLGLAKQYDAALAELKKVVGTPGYKNTAGYTNLGWVYRNMEPSKPQESLTAYQKALELDPKNEQAALGMGWALAYLDKYDEAIGSFEKAIQLEPKIAAEAHNGIAWCHYFKKDMAKAKAAAEKAKAEGRNVASLLSTIDKFEKGQTQAAEQAKQQFKQEQQQKEEGGPGDVGGRIMKGSPASKIQAIREMVRYGGAGVQYLGYAAFNDDDLNVREAAINALGAVGGAARSYCPQLKHIAFGANPYESTFADKAQMEKAIRYGDLQKTARAALAKIGC